MFVVTRLPPGKRQCRHNSREVPLVFITEDSRVHFHQINTIARSLFVKFFYYHLFQYAFVGNGNVSFCFFLFFFYTFFNFMQKWWAFWCLICYLLIPLVFLYKSSINFLSISLFYAFHNFLIMFPWLSFTDCVIHFYFNNVVNLA